MRWLLPLSWLYGAGVWLRNSLFDSGLLRIHHAVIPVISVGNISAGGTGKTPLVEYLAVQLRERGKRVAVLSRGYGRSTSGYQVVSNGRQRCADAVSAGDEPAQMADNLEHVVVAVDEKRARGAQHVVAEFSPDVIVLDDGFQHRALARTKDIVVLTASEIMEPSRLLPAGFRREPWSSLDRADVLVISGSGTEDEYRQAETRILQRVKKPVVELQIRPTGVSGLVSNTVVRREDLTGKTYAAFSGIGNPKAFGRTVTEFFQSPARHEIFEDHHRYTKEDLERLYRVAESVHAEFLVTTQKDAFRLRTLPGIATINDRIPIYVLRVSAGIPDGDSLMKRIMESF